MYKTLITTFAALCLIHLSLASAETRSTGWKTSAELGYVATQGNTDTEILNAKISSETDKEKWRHKLEASALNASDENGTTAENYQLSGQSDYKLNDPNYLFGLINYDNDRFSGYDYQISESIGYGRRVIGREALKLDLEIGPGARHSKIEGGNTETEALVRGAAKLNWNMSESSLFSETLTVESGEDSTISKSVTGLSSRLNGKLSMKMTYTLTHTSEVPDGVDNTDSETAITLVYAF